ncbi:hypothetical protein D3C81_1860080 [compost metagenome]
MALRRIALKPEVEGRQAIEGNVHLLHVIVIFTLVGIFAKHLGLRGDPVFTLQPGAESF